MNDKIALCRGCSVKGTPCRFGADDFVTVGPAEAIARLCCPGAFEGGAQVAHGGWTAAAFDDVMGRFLTQTGRRAVTATLTIGYQAPVPVETPLELTVRIGANEGRRWPLSAVLRLRGDDRALATAEGVWVERRPDHFERHQSRMAEYKKSVEGV